MSGTVSYSSKRGRPMTKAQKKVEQSVRSYVSNASSTFTVNDISKEKKVSKIRATHALRRLAQQGVIQPVGNASTGKRGKPPKVYDRVSP